MAYLDEGAQYPGLSPWTEPSISWTVSLADSWGLHFMSGRSDMKLRAEAVGSARAGEVQVLEPGGPGAFLALGERERLREVRGGVPELGAPALDELQLPQADERRARAQ